MKSFRLTILTALAALILLIGCGGSDNSAKYGKLLFERDLATTTVNMNIHQPVLIFKKDSMESADYNITYKIEEQSEIHACHKAHSKVVSLQIIDSEGNERLNYSDTEGCRNIDLEPGTYTVKLGTLPSSNLFVYNKTADSKTCSNVNSCIDLINQSGGCTNCTFSHFFLSPDLDKPTTKMDFTNHDFSGTSWTNGVIIQADFNGSDFSGGIFGDSCNGDSCTADTDGVFGAKNSFSSCKFNSTRFNAGKLSGDYSHSTFSDASLSNMWDFLFLSSDQNQTDASKIIKEFYSERYGSGHEFNLTQFGIDTIKSGGVNYYEDTSVLDHIDFSTASVGDDKSNLGLFENASMQGVTFPSKGKMDLNGINLYKTDLTGVDFSSTGSEMAEADLRYADLTDVDFSGKDLVNAKLGCNTKMNGTDLSNVDINNLDYSSIKEKECVIEADGIIIGPNINFNNTTFQNLLKYFDLSKVDFSGLTFTGTDLTDFSCKSCIFKNAMFDRAIFSHTDFGSADLEGATFKNLNINALLLPNTSLKGAKFDGVAGWNIYHLDRANCSQTSFLNMDLSHTDFHWLQLSGADFSGHDLSSAIFEHANLENANFSGAVFSQNTNLDNATLTEVILRDANLSDMNLSGINFQYADFKLTSLENSDLSGSDLRYTKNMEFAIFTSETTFRGADVSGVNFAAMTLAGMDFSYIKCAHTSFSLANLKNANMRHADCSTSSDDDRTAFVFAKLDGADLSYSNINNADFTGAVFNYGDYEGMQCKYVKIFGTTWQGRECALGELSDDCSKLECW